MTELKGVTGMLAPECSIGVRSRCRSLVKVISAVVGSNNLLDYQRSGLQGSRLSECESKGSALPVRSGGNIDAVESCPQ